MTATNNLTIGVCKARGTGNTYADHDMTWDNTGKNGHYAEFRWP